MHTDFAIPGRKVLMRRKPHLGKGLYALISSDIPDAVPLSEAVRELEVALIDPNPFQPRLAFDVESLEELKNSIREKGVIQPVLVRPRENGRYQLVAGERRLRATIALGKKTIPAYIKKVDSDEMMLEIALVENVQREQLNPIDLAKGYRQLMEECRLTQEEIAQKIGKSRAAISNNLRLLKLSLEIQKSLKGGEIKEGHARALLSISDAEEQKKIWQKTVKEDLSVRSVEQLARKYKKKLDAQLPVKSPWPRKAVYLKKLEGQLREILGTSVKIRTRKDGGVIEVVFYSPADLQRLMNIFEQIEF
jgi:ParB family chromosome partitioning protein